MTNAAGIKDLTDAELAVAAAAAEGLTVEQSATRLGMSRAAVRNRTRWACERVGAANRAELVAMLFRARRLGHDHLGRVEVDPRPVFYLLDRALYRDELGQVASSPPRSARPRSSGWSAAPAPPSPPGMRWPPATASRRWR